MEDITSYMRGWPNRLNGTRHVEGYENDALVDGTVWEEFLEHLRRAGEVVQRPDIPSSPLTRAEGYKHIVSLAQVGIMEAFAAADPLAPVFDQRRNDAFKWGVDCPDGLYRRSPIRGDLNYRVHGNVGTVRYLSFQANAAGTNHGNLRGDQLVVEPDGSFELFIGPTPRGENQLRIPPEVDFLMVRQFFYDWDRERPATLHIEQLDGVEPTDDLNAATPERVAVQLRELGEFIVANAAYWADVEARFRADHRNAFEPASPKPELGSAVENANGWGYFDLAPDEALLVEVRPSGHYWSLHLGNSWWESLDYANHQSSLNGHQAMLDDDGRFRAVVAHQDPGVPNWLDTVGHPQGLLMWRWIVTDTIPVATTEVVPFREVRAHLPAGTPAVDPAARAAVIRRRRQHVARRFNPA